MPKHIHVHLHTAPHRTKDMGSYPDADTVPASLAPETIPAVSTEHIGPGIVEEVASPEFVTDFIEKYKTLEKQTSELATRSVEHLQKVYWLLQVHECMNEETNGIRKLVKEELERREMPKL